VTRKKIVVKDKDKKKDDLDPMKDKFISRSATAFTWLMDRRKPFGIAAATLLVAIVAAIAVSSLLNSKRAEAASTLEKGLEADLAPVVPLADRPKDLEKTNPDLVLFETRKARAEESKRRFEKAASDLAGKPAGDIARLGLAASLQDLGAYDKAEAEYQKFLDDASDGADWLKANALEGLGQALEAQGKLDEARKRYQQLGDMNAGDLSAMGRVHEARVAAAKGDKDAAKKLLTEVIAAAKAGARIDASNLAFVQARAQLLVLDPGADVPRLPATGLSGLDGIDPALLEQLLKSQQAAGADAP
jgi:tetratricopeptide (TPR) repeat protein